MKNKSNTNRKLKQNLVSRSFIVALAAVWMLASLTALAWNNQSQRHRHRL